MEHTSVTLTISSRVFFNLFGAKAHISHRGGKPSPRTPLSKTCHKKMDKQVHYVISVGGIDQLTQHLFFLRENKPF